MLPGISVGKATACWRFSLDFSACFTFSKQAVFVHTMHILLLVGPAPLFIVLMNKTAPEDSTGFSLALAVTITCSKHSIIKNISGSS